MPHVPERLFFGTVHTELTGLLGAPSMESLMAERTVTLPDRLHHILLNAVQATQTDFRERWMHLGLQGDGTVAVRDSGISEEFSPEKRIISGQSFRAFALWPRALFGRPIPLDFHTHPVLTETYLRSKGIRQLTNGVLHLGLPQIARFTAIIARHFSYDDLTVDENYPRLIRASMLASPRGIRLLVRQPDMLPWVVSDRHAKEYGAAYTTLINRTTDYAAAGYAIDEQTLDRTVDILLRRFADAVGMTAFGNTDPHDPTLTRIL